MALPLLSEFNQQLGVLPTDPVKLGDRWRREETMEVGGGQALHFVNYYEYAGELTKDGRKLDKFTVYSESVSFSLAEDSPLPLKVTKSDLQIAESSGTVLFDRALGRIVERHSRKQITGQMTFSINNMELPGKLDLTFDQGRVDLPMK